VSGLPAGLDGAGILAWLAERGVEVTAAGDQLRLRAPKRLLSPALRDELARRKPELLALLGSAAGDGGELAAAAAPAIEAGPRGGSPPLSLGQEALWFLDQLDPGHAVYNSHLALRLTGRLDTGALAAALEEVNRRHDVLRATFVADGGTPRQTIAPPVAVPMPVTDLGRLPAPKREAEARRLAAEEAARPFDLATGPLLRAALLRLGEAEHVLLLTLHHIVSDGWSMDVLAGELVALYGARRRGEPSPLPDPLLQYADFARWQRDWLQGDTLAGEVEHWRRRLAGAPPRLNLPTDRPRPPVMTFEGAHRRYRLSAELTEGLRELGRAHQATLFMTLLTVFDALLHRHAGQDDVLVSTGVANRGRPELQPLIGFFVNNLVLRMDLSGNPTFRELLGRVRDATLDAYAHQDLPFQRLVRELTPDLSPSHAPFAQVSLTLDVPTGLPQVPGLRVERLEVERGAAVTDLVFNFREGNGLDCRVEYNTHLFAPERIDQFWEHLEALARAMVTDPDQGVATFPLFAEEMASLLGVPQERLQRVAPLSITQRDVWLEQMVKPDSTVFSVGGRLRLGPDLDERCWRRAVEFVAANEDLARTRLFVFRGEPHQFVDPEQGIEYEFVDLAGRDDGQRADELIDREIARRYELLGGPLIRTMLVRDREGQYTAGFMCHHLVSDVRSAEILLERVAAAYRALVAGRVPEPPAGRSFYDYVGESLRRFDARDVRQFWAERLGAVAVLGADHPAGGAPRPVAHPVRLEGERLRQVKDCCARLGCSPYAFFLVLYATLLQRWFQPDGDFVLYEIVTDRQPEDFQTIGCFYTVVPLVLPRPLFAGGQVADCLRYVSGYRRRLGRNTGVSSLWQRKLVGDEPLRCYYNYSFQSRQELAGREVVSEIRETYDEDAVELAVRDFGEAIQLELHHNEKHLRDPALAERLLALADGVADGVPLADLGICLPDEARRIAAWNHTASPYPRDATLHELFEVQGRRAPDAPAVTFEARTLSYRELDRRAGRLAGWLRARGVGPDTLVALLTERSLEMIVAMVATVKAGGAYAPLEPDTPSARLRTLLDDLRSPVLLTQRLLVDRVEAAGGFAGEVCCLDEELDGLPQPAPAAAGAGHSAERLAYVNFTSGSTGRPKGVLISHRAVARTLIGADYLQVRPDDAFLQVSTYAWDAATFEIWGALLAGARVVLVRREDVLDFDRLAAIVGRERITVMYLTSPLFNQVIDQAPQALRGLRTLMVGGETASPPHFARARQHLAGTRLINEYGPTENTVFSTWQLVDRVEPGAAAIPIGRPLANSTAYVLDRDLRPLPVGAAGELFLGGAGLARGYLNRPGRTAEAFVPSPFQPGERLYRTGDLARWRADGTLDFLGRRDFQVKIRGHRVEPAEVEHVLTEHPAVHDAVVAVVEPPGGERQLVGYLAAPEGVGEPELRAFLADRLPAYMVPARLVLLDRLPLAPNGKVDRAALPVPDQAERATPYVAPRNPTEARLAEIWAEVLAVERVGIDDDFFELGGHSLSATRAVYRVREAFEVELPLRRLFECRTVARLAAAVEEAVLAEIEAMSEEEAERLSGGPP
jgi:amino acid adenylation domain-containing protein